MIALFDADDGLHIPVLEWVKDFEGKLISTWPVVTEVTHLLDFSVKTQLEFLEWIERGAVVIFELQAHHLREIRNTIHKYSDLPADFADATLLVAAHEMKVDEILSLDHHFSVFRTKKGDPLIQVLDL